MGWTFYCHYELQCRIELFHLFTTCCQALRGPCAVPLPFGVTIPGLKSSNFEFASCVSSLQCSLASIQKCESLFIDSVALPRAFELFNRGPGLILKRKFSVWNILSSTHFLKTRLLSSLNGYYAKSEGINERSWIVTDETASLSPVRSSSAEGTPVKRVPGSADSTPLKNPVFRRLTEVPVISDVPVKVISRKRGMLVFFSGRLSSKITRMDVRSISFVILLYLVVFICLTFPQGKKKKIFRELNFVDFCF